MGQETGQGRCASTSGPRPAAARSSPGAGGRPRRRAAPPRWGRARLRPGQSEQARDRSCRQVFVPGRRLAGAWPAPQGAARARRACPLLSCVQPASPMARPSASASSNAWLVPWASAVVARCAASPSRLTRPRPHTCTQAGWGGVLGGEAASAAGRAGSSGEASRGTVSQPAVPAVHGPCMCRPARPPTLQAPGSR